jgi:hypothetical protein
MVSASGRAASWFGWNRRPGREATVDQASRTLVEAGVGEDPYGIPAAELLPLRLAAADAVVAERRAQVPILERRAKDAGLDRVTRLGRVSKA